MSKNVHRIEIAGVVRDLPIREVAPGVRVALFNILGDWELTEAAGKALARLVPIGTELLVMPEGKAIALLHVMGRETGLPTIVARKEKKPYMSDPVLEYRYKSITTDRVQTLYLGADDARKFRRPLGTGVAIVDDVVSSGGTLEAMRGLVVAAEGVVIGVMAVLTEGQRRDDVIALGHLPLF